MLRVSQRDFFFKLGERCLEGVWQRYSDLILSQFTHCQRQTLIGLTAEIRTTNIYADLIRYRSGVNSADTAFPDALPGVLKVDLGAKTSNYNEQIIAMMVQVYDFERDEQRLYLEAGAKTRMEPYLLSLFWCQVTDGPSTWALLLLKWWARL